MGAVLCARTFYLTSSVMRATRVFFCFVLFLLFFKSWGIIYYLEPTTIRIHLGRDKAGHHYHDKQAPVSRASRHPWPTSIHNGFVSPTRGMRHTRRVEDVGSVFAASTLTNYHVA